MTHSLSFSLTPAIAPPSTPVPHAAAGAAAAVAAPADTDLQPLANPSATTAPRNAMFDRLPDDVRQFLGEAPRTPHLPNEVLNEVALHAFDSALDERGRSPEWLGALGIAATARQYKAAYAGMRQELFAYHDITQRAGAATNVAQARALIGRPGDAGTIANLPHVQRLRPLAALWHAARRMNVFESRPAREAVHAEIASLPPSMASRALAAIAGNDLPLNHVGLLLNAQTPGTVRRLPPHDQIQPLRRLLALVTRNDPGRLTFAHRYVEDAINALPAGIGQDLKDAVARASRTRGNAYRNAMA